MLTALVAVRPGMILVVTKATDRKEQLIMVELERPQLGRPAPDFELSDSSGDVWSLRKQRGRPVLLIFHRHIH